MVVLKKHQTKNHWELIEAVKAGDQNATAELYNKINAFCRNIIRQKKYGICKEDLDVLSHEITTEILLNKLQYYSSDKVLFPWLYRIIYNKIIDQFRAEKKSIFFSNNRVYLTENTVPFFDENDQYFLEEKTRLINASILLLSHPKQELIFLKYYEKKTIEEIAQLKNKSVRAIASELFRTRAVLKRILLKGGYKGSGKK